MYAGKKNIQGIFDRSWDLQIPFFQRSYVWKEEEWARFLTDMYDVCEHKQEYFLGSVILKKYSEENQNSMVIDGQQRLTTLVIFFKVLSLKQKNHEQEFDVSFKKMKDKTSILKHNKNDQKSFEQILNMASLQKIDNPLNKVDECYNHFVEHMDESRLNWFDLFENIAFVGIGLDFHENEQQIFDTINSLGVRLSTAELLKNLFFKVDDIDFYEKHWQAIFETDNETIRYWNETANKKDGKTLIDVFLFSFLQIKAKELPAGVAKTNFGNISYLLKSYKKLMPYIEDKSVFFEDLSEYATIFRKSINPKIAEKPLETQLDRMNLLIFESNLLSVLPYMMFLLVHYQYAPEQLDEVLFVLESYLMRRMVGVERSTIATKDYHELFGNRLISQDIYSAKALKIHLNAYRASHLNFVPTDNQIKLLLKNKKQTRERTALILYLLENKIRQKDGKDTLYGFEKYSAEYFMPVKWQKNWERPMDEEARNLAIKTLGNATIIPVKLNPALKEADWHTRVRGTGRIKGLMDYSSLSFAKHILHKPKWTDDDIFQNNEKIANRIIETWHLN